MTSLSWFKNSTLPSSKSEVFSTAGDGHTNVDINVLQGERDFVKDNKSLGSFGLDVSASVKCIGKKQDITITGSSTLPKDEVDHMVQEAKRFANDDKEKREAIDEKKQADSVNYYLERHILDMILGWTGAEVEAGAPGAGLSPGGEDASSADSSSGKGRDDVIDADFTNSNEKMN
ncbi:BnaC08g11610D [Brassica napus]|uniref:BnaC08g11610D protein n=1 Tax=Brassica napus TaxID=3708 RepID=A0A078F6A7_BRANA|nr:BnaC08g11610D [Brassica napus]